MGTRYNTRDRNRNGHPAWGRVERPWGTNLCGMHEHRPGATHHHAPGWGSSLPRRRERISWMGAPGGWGNPCHKMCRGMLKCTHARICVCICGGLGEIRKSTYVGGAVCAAKCCHWSTLGCVGLLMCRFAGPQEGRTGLPSTLKVHRGLELRRRAREGKDFTAPSSTDLLN